MGKAAPNPPPYRYDADKQGGSGVANTQTQTQANRPNQDTPFASSHWVQDDVGNWHQQAGFNGPMAGAADSVQQQIASALSQPINNGQQARDQAINATYNQMASRLNPQFAQAGSQMETQLANQGLSPGSAAYRQAQAQFARGKNDAYQGAMNNAVQQGLAAQNLTFNQNRIAHSQPLMDAQGLNGFLSMPGFATAERADATPYLAADVALGNYNLQGAQMENSSTGGLMSGLGSMLGMLAFL